MQAAQLSSTGLGGRTNYLR